MYVMVNFSKNPIFFGSDPNALKIIAYFDEFELANPLESKAKYNKIGMLYVRWNCDIKINNIWITKTGAIYFTLANIDPAQRSSLDAINLIALFPCNLLDTYCIDSILEPVFENVKKLSAVSCHAWFTCQWMICPVLLLQQMGMSLISRAE